MFGKTTGGLPDPEPGAHTELPVHWPDSKATPCGGKSISAKIDSTGLIFGIVRQE